MKNRALYLSSLASLFARLMLDPRYDDLADHPVIADIRNGDRATKISAVTLLNAVGAYVDTHMRTDTPFRKFFSGLAVDAGTEVGSRMVHQPKGRSSDIWQITELNDEQLETFLNWWEGADERERKGAREFVLRQTSAQLLRLLNLPPDTRRRLMAFATAPSPYIPRRISAVDDIIRRMRRPLLSF